MATKLNPNQGTEICDLLRKYGEGEWWFESAYQQFNRLTTSCISAEVMTVTEAFNLMLGLFRRMETEKEIVLKMLPHYDPKVVIWSAFHSEVAACFEQVYPGCAEPLDDSEIKLIIERYILYVADYLEDWERMLRDAIKEEAPRTMEIESCQKG